MKRRVFITMAMVLGCALGGCPCDVTDDKPPLVIDKEMVYEAPTTLNAGKVVFKPGGKIVLRPGADLVIDADRVVAEGTTILIEGAGATGPTGSKGAACDHCNQGNWVTTDMGAFNGALKDCAEGRAPFNYGKKGGAGGPGGAAPNVTIRARSVVGQITCDLRGGQGGPGGQGGDGRWLCHNECGDGHPMYECSRGPQGDPGPTGAPGKCELITR